MAKATKMKGTFGDLFVKSLPKKVSGFTKILDEYIYDTFNNKHNEFKETASSKKGIPWHASQIGKICCSRKFAYQFTNAEYDYKTKAFSAGTLRIFQNGHSVHTRLQSFIAGMHKWSKGEVTLLGKWRCGCGKIMGGDMPNKWIPLPKSCRKCKRKTKIVYREVVLSSDIWPIVGRTDGVIEWLGEKYLLEIKSVNPFDFPKLIEVPVFYLPQANFYMYMSGIHEMIYLAECKGTQRLKEFRLEYDYNIIEPYLKLMELALKAVARNKFPNRLKDPKKIVLHCEDCEYKKTCFAPDDFGYNLPLPE